MAQASRLTERGYLRAVEGAWSRHRGRAVVLSPREYELVTGWHRRGIPLALVLEALAHRGRRGGGAGSLTGLASAVEAAWSAVAEGRSAAAPAPRPEATPDPWAAWERVRAGSAHPPLRDLVGGLLARARSGAPAAELDAALDRELWTAAPPELRAEVDARANEALRPFRDRMPEAELQRTHARARADGLRERLGLLRLALGDGGSGSSPPRRG